MRQLWIWLLVPLASGWGLFPTNDFFFHKAQKKIDSLHQSLVLPDSHQMASGKVKETDFSKRGTMSKGSNEGEYDESSHGVEVDHGKSKVDKEESRHKGHTGKEKLSKEYGEQAGKKQITNSKNGKQQNEHISQEGGKGGFFKDKLLYKSGNYEKGYRNKYHLDEELKHDKFWNDHRSLDKFHKYGKHGSHFHKVLQKKEKKTDKKESESNEDDGKKGETAGGSVSSDHKGHQSKKGKDLHYEHKEEYHKKKP